MIPCDCGIKDGSTAVASSQELSEEFSVAGIRVVLKGVEIFAHAVPNSSRGG
jgi:hypothetical protein